MRSILLIDDDEQITDILSLVLEAEGYRIESCVSPAAAVEALRCRDFSVVLLDLRLGDYDGLELLPTLREIDPDVPIFMITAHGDVDSAVNAFARGANGYVRKPFRDGELKDQIARAIEAFEVKRAVRLVRSGRESDKAARSIIRTCDPSMDALLKRVETAARVASNVVIHGESGSGKELVARALHQLGPRAKAPFIAFNCAAVPETLIESELFGFVKGAFTDARENKQGLFARANGGTLFLDEIGDASPSVQAKLLRVLQEREVLPLGATQAIPIDVRVVAATHKSLEKEVAEGRLRQDLYYRLHVVPLTVPPLRDRPKDVLFLAQLFGERLATQLGQAFPGFSLSAEEMCRSHPWPGNIRELQNRVEHAMVLGGGGRIRASELFPESQTTEEAEERDLFRAPAFSTLEEAVPTFGEAKASFERSYLEKVLRAARGNIAKAARIASKSRTEVYGLLRKHGLDPLHFKSGSPSSAESE